MRDQSSTTTTDFQINHAQRFIEADEHLAMAVSLIEEGRSNSATAAMKVCVLILDLLTSIRIPLRRLGSINSEATMLPRPIQATAQPMVGAV